MMASLLRLLATQWGVMKWLTSFGIVSGEWEGFSLTDGLLILAVIAGDWAINERGEVVALTDRTLTHRGEITGIHGGVAAKTINAFLKELQSPSLGQILQMLMGGYSALYEDVILVFSVTAVIVVALLLVSCAIFVLTGN